MRTDWKKQTRVVFYLCCCSVRAGRGGNSWLVRTFLFDKSWADPGIELDSHKTGSCSVPQLVVSIQLTARCFRLRSLSSFLSSSPHGLSPRRKLPWITPVSQVDISLVGTPVRGHSTVVDPLSPLSGVRPAPDWLPGAVGGEEQLPASQWLAGGGAARPPSLWQEAGQTVEEHRQEAGNGN